MRYFKCRYCGVNKDTHNMEYEVTEYKRAFGHNYDFTTYDQKYTREQLFDMLVLVNKSKIEFV